MLLTGLTGSGKTTIAYALERQLFDEGRAVVVLDGQNMRRGISHDLGFTADERSENLRRSAEVAKLFNDAGIIVSAAFVAPEEAVRQKAAATIGNDRFLVVHLSAPLEVCRQREHRGPLQTGRHRRHAAFPRRQQPLRAAGRTRLGSATDHLSVDQCVTQILGLLASKGVAE